MSAPRLVYACTEHEDCRDHPEIGVACWASRAGGGYPLRSYVVDGQYGDWVDADMIQGMAETIEVQRRMLRAQEQRHRGAWTVAEASAYVGTGVEPGTK